MTCSDDMLTAARRGVRRLGARAAAVGRFVEGRHQPDGGFRGRGPASDLYYTVFGIDCLLAFDPPCPPPRTAAYLAQFGDGADLDFMHLVSLIRCRSRLAAGRGEPGLTSRLSSRLMSFSSPDGGFTTTAGAAHGSVTAAFLACAACQDAGVPPPAPAGVLASLERLRTVDGGYANVPGLRSGTTLATAGALAVRHWMGQPADLATAQWILDQYQNDGGFLATPGAPVADLLSTATAVFALHTGGFDLSGLVPACPAFIDRLQQPDGGFRGHALDSAADCEYTFYALMALGCLTDE